MAHLGAVHRQAAATGRAAPSPLLSPSIRRPAPFTAAAPGPATLQGPAAAHLCSPQIQVPAQVQQPRHRRQRVAASAASSASASATELQVVKENLSETQRRLTITVPAAGVKQCFHAAVDKMREIAGDMPGFRKDKIPLSIIIQQCGGQRNFKMTCIEEVLLTALPLAMEQAVKQEGVVPDSERVVSDIKELEAVFDPAKPLTFAVQYDCVPPLTWKQSYKELEVTIQDTGDFTTDAAAVEDLIRQLLKEKGHQKVAAGRGLQQGDTAIVDLKFTQQGSKIPLPGLSSSRARIDTDVDPLSLVPHLLGAKVGETRRFTITLPKDYQVELWQGMACDVEVAFKELFAWELPQFDDAFVKEHYPGQFETAEDLRKSLLATTAMERVQQLDQVLGEAVQKVVVEAVERPSLPETLVEDMGATQYRAVLLDMIEKKMATAEEVDKLATPEMVQEYISKKRTELEDLCIFNVAADEIWAAEQLSIEDKDVQEEVEVRKKQYEAQQLEYDEQAIREQVVDTFKHLRVVEWLKDNLKRNVLPWKSA